MMEQLGWDDQRVVRASTRLIRDALALKAEQVQFNPNANRTYTVAFIRDEELVHHKEFPEGIARAVMGRFKIMGGITDLRSTEAQEGRFLFPNEGTKEWFLNVQPTSNGERMLLSITEDLDGR